MGTRADLYVGVGENAEWIGSFAWDGYPENVKTFMPLLNEEPMPEEVFRANARLYLESLGEDATWPQNGWPWPWDNSATTDYAYAWIEGTVLISNYGSPWYQYKNYLDFKQSERYQTEDWEPVGPAPVFPDMSDRKNIRWDMMRNV